VPLSLSLSLCLSLSVSLSHPLVDLLFDATLRQKLLSIAEIRDTLLRQMDESKKAFDDEVLAQSRPPPSLPPHANPQQKKKQMKSSQEISSSIDSLSPVVITGLLFPETPHV
jgi:hypothetical protein